MSALVQGPFNLLANISRGISEAARASQRDAEAMPWDNSISHGERGRMMIQAMNDLREHASSRNWDGYGGAPVNDQSIKYAAELFALLPLDTPLPDVSVDPDGEVALDWDAGPRSVFSVSIGRDGTLTYAGLFGYSKVHGVEVLSSALPAAIREGIARALNGAAVQA